MSDDEPIQVEMAKGQWDVVIHALEEEMAQLAPPDENWIGKYPGEEDAEAIGEVHGEIMEAVT